MIKNEQCNNSKSEGGLDGYQPANIEFKWNERWDKDKLYQARIDGSREKHYCLTMLPYPSGDLHIGHWYTMAPSDARARYMRMNGYNVMFPIGFDSFGLPAENAAIAHDVHPKEWTYTNISRMRSQLNSMGAMWDWERETTSSDSKYYQWTQWYFLKLLTSGLAYRKEAAVDFCPRCNTTLAREQVHGDERLCERCDTPVTKRTLSQWFLRITQYAEELLKFDGIDWPERVRTLQTNWIGRSEGARVDFRTEQGDELEVFTTRPDTLWGVTFMVLAPEHPLVEKLTLPEQSAQVSKYVKVATRQTEIERQSVGRKIRGIFTGSYAFNPVNGERIPIWIADYVLMTYGTGAIMAVPAHDERDFMFARAHGIVIRPVIQPENSEPLDPNTMTEAVITTGSMVASGPLTGTSSKYAISKSLEWLQERGFGRAEVNYRLRDWLISRQRYWGCPIPVIHCSECGVVPVPEMELPIELPEDIEWRPTGESPLKFHRNWKYTKCPQCGIPAERETDTMDTFVCSSWYHLRYLSPDCTDHPFSDEEYRYWMPVDVYTGGIEHATMHLIYTRFFHKACRDIGIVTGDEPMVKLRNQGQILGPDGHRMSKSRGNVVDPDDQVRRYGADTVRAFLMFGYRWTEGGPWTDGNIKGVARWIRRVWELTLRLEQSKEIVGEIVRERGLQRVIHQTIQKVSNDLEQFEFNTVVSALMQLTNALQSAELEIGMTPAYQEGVVTLLKLMAPITPYVAEELWSRLGQPYSIHQQSWPKADPSLAEDDLITLIVQVNGKVRSRLNISTEMDEEAVRKLAEKAPNVARAIGSKKPSRVVYIDGKLLNFVV